jgi:predicted MFS family arabinose efflux permease
VGGLFVTAWGWPSIFFVNLPVGLAALAGVPRLRRLGYGGGSELTARFDPVGLALLCVGLTGFVYGVSEAPTHDWFSRAAGPFWLGGLVLIALYVGWAWRRRDPALDLHLLRHGRSALALVLCVLASVAMFGVLFLLPVLIQSIQGHGALASGLVLLPQGIVMGLSTKVGRDLTGRRLRRAIVVGCAAIAVTGATLALVDVRTPLWIIALIMAGRGLGIGLVIQPLLTGMLAGLPERELAHANPLFNVGQRLGGSLGVGLLATLYSTRVASGAGALNGFQETVLAAAGVAVVALVVATFVRPVAE